MTLPYGNMADRNQFAGVPVNAALLQMLLLAVARKECHSTAQPRLGFGVLLSYCKCRLAACRLDAGNQLAEL